MDAPPSFPPLRPDHGAEVEACLQAIDAFEPVLHALITVDAQGARATASRLDQEGRGGRETEATKKGGRGLIVTLKDNIDTAGLRTTAGSRLFFDRVPSEDAEVTRRLRCADAIIVGKANMHELAFGATSQNPHHGSCRNPWNVSCIPGGSSGGSGAAVAAGMCEGSLGTDTGGSVRIPAALTGVVGLRPTLGRISNRGSLPSSPRFDTIGPLARDAVTVARLYEAVAGHDPLDPTSVDQPVERMKDGGGALSGRVIAVPHAYFFEGAEPEVAQAVLSALDVLCTLGAVHRAVTLPRAQEAHDRMACVIRADAAAVHRDRLERNPEMFGTDVLARFTLGLKTSAQDYAAGLAEGDRWRATVLEAFDRCDLILTPTVGFGAPEAAGSSDMVERTHALTRMTFVWSFCGLPAISIPCGFTAKGLPIGMQLIGPPWSEAPLLAVAIAYQTVTDFHLRRPSLTRRSIEGDL